MSYKYSKQDYLERKQRCDDGQGSDEDRRLVKMYEAPKPSGGPIAGTYAYDLVYDARVSVDGVDQGPGTPGKTAEPGKYEGLTYAEVQRQAKERGLNAGGTHEEIVARLEEKDRETSTN